MNNITVFAVFVMFIFAQTVYAQETKKNVSEAYCISINPCFGIVHGQSEEIVYPPSHVKAEYLSRLLWDIRPVYYYGVQMDFSPADPMERRGVFSNVSLKFGIPGWSGKMENRDWMSIENSELTHFSTHYNYSREMFLFDVCAGYAFPFLNVMLLKAYVNVSCMRLRYSGIDGFGKYARQIIKNSDGTGTFFPIDDKPNIREYRDIVINYSQDWLIASPGVSFGYCLNKRFFTGLSFQISPLIMCSGWDEHFYQDDTKDFIIVSATQFNDQMRGGLFIEFGAVLSFIINKYTSMSFEYSRRDIKRTKGSSYNRSYGSDYFTQSGTAGAGLTVNDFALIFKVNL